MPKDPFDAQEAALRQKKFLRIVDGLFLLSVAAYWYALHIIPLKVPRSGDLKVLKESLSTISVLYAAVVLYLRFVRIPKLAAPGEAMRQGRLKRILSLHIVAAIFSEAIVLTGFAFAVMTGVRSEAQYFFLAGGILLVILFQYPGTPLDS